jgi:Sec-independent protein secretion pathway component TatC
MAIPLLGLYFVSFLVVHVVAAGRKTPEPGSGTL